MVCVCDPFSVFSIPQLFTIEQVQVLKGAPAGALYGAGEPVALSTYVTKKPTYEQKKHVENQCWKQRFF